MSRRQTYLLVCYNCPERYVPGGIDPPARLGAVRAEATIRGWEHRLVVVDRGLAPSLDFCPACVSKQAPYHHEERIRRDKKARA